MESKIKIRNEVFTLVFAILISFMCESFAFSTGADKLACNNMRPLHFPFSPKKSAPPYSILVTVNPRGLFDVTITGEKNFVGFFVQSLGVHGKSVGQFVQIPRHTRYLDCHYDKSSVTHDGSRQRSHIQVEWNPHGYKGLVLFRATVVKSFSDFWTNIDTTFTV